MCSTVVSKSPRSICCLRIAQDVTATPTERLKAASEAARFLLPKKPGPKKSRRGKFPPDEYGFSVDPNLARELRDAKLQLALFAAFQQKAHSLGRRAESEQASSSDKRDPGIAAMSVPLQIQIDVQLSRFSNCETKLTA
jgi:hypothetical protein